MSVQFKAVVGRTDQAEGLVAPLQGQRQLLRRVGHALEDNVRLYKIENGDRKQFAGAG